MKLAVRVSDPKAGLKVRRWREKCRREGRLSFIIVEDATHTRIEIRPPKPDHSFADFSALYGKYKWAGSSGTLSESNLTLTGHYPHAELERDILEILRLPRQPLKISISEIECGPGAIKEERTAIAGFARTLDPGPDPRIVFSDEEYNVVSAALEASGEIPPVALSVWATPDSFVDYPLNLRLQTWPEGLTQELVAKRGKYLWESRFSSIIKLTDGVPVPRATCSRPGILGKDAIVQVSCASLTGFMLLKKAGGKWKAVQTSHDEDWGPASWEHTSILETEGLASFPEFVPEFEEWRRYPLPFPCPAKEFVQPLGVEESHQLYDSISRGLFPEIASGLPIPLCDGRIITPDAILSEAGETFDVHLNAEPSKITKRLADQGKSVILLNSDSSPSVAKLIAYWGREFSIIRVDDTYAQTKPPTQEQQRILEQLGTLFRDSGIQSVDFGVADTYMPDFYFLAKGSELARRDHPTPFEHTGTVLISQSYMDSRFSLSERVLAGLCSWGDPDGTYAEAILRAAGLWDPHSIEGRQDAE